MRTGATGGVSPVLGAVLWGLNLALLLLLMPFLVYDVQRMGYATPISYNEGWNAFPTSRLVHNGPLYPALTGALPVTPVSYPPLSFLFVATLAHLTDHVVLVGRCLAFAAFLCVAVLIFVIVQRLQPNRPAATMGALLWLTLVVRAANGYVGMYDPQMVGQVFSLGALALFARWRDDMIPWHIWGLAFLCCVALFIKPVFVAVPISLAVTMLLRNRRQFLYFAWVLAATGLLMMIGSRLFFGPNLLPNLLVNHDRWWDLRKTSYVALVTLARLSLLMVFIPLFLFKVRKIAPLPLVYLTASALTAAYFFGLAGTGENIWFDFFAAVSIGWALFAGQLSVPKPVYARWFIGGMLVTGVAAFASTSLAADLHTVLDYAALRRDAQEYQKEIGLIRSTPGPALFEYPLVGFDAGKEFLWDPFWGTELILMRRLPESVITGPIEAREFSVIALSFELSKAVARIGAPESADRQAGWTNNTLLAIDENYRLLGHWYSYIYVPRNEDPGSKKGVVKKDD